MPDLDPVAPRDRLSRDQRRSQLLDVAAELAIAGGGPVTMEGIAKAAGVSKALPYKHFDNVTSLLAALYRREARRVGQEVWAALSDAGPGTDLVRVWVVAHFDALARHGAVLRVLSTPGSPVHSLADARGTAAEAVAVVLRRFFGMDGEHARSVADIIQGAFVGAARSWMVGAASRAVLEERLVDVIRTVTTAPSLGRRRPRLANVLRRPR